MKSKAVVIVGLPLTLIAGFALGAYSQSGHYPRAAAHAHLHALQLHLAYQAPPNGIPVAAPLTEAQLHAHARQHTAISMLELGQNFSNLRDKDGFSQHRAVVAAQRITADPGLVDTGDTQQQQRVLHTANCIINHAQQGAAAVQQCIAADAV